MKKRPTNKKVSTSSRSLFKQKRPLPKAVSAAADIWIDCFIDYARILIEEEVQSGHIPTLPGSNRIDYSASTERARTYADATLHTIQDRWPEVDLSK